MSNKNEIEVVAHERLSPAIEVAKKFIAKGWSRPVLQYIGLFENGEIHASDSHRGIILKGVHSYESGLTLNPKTREIMKGNNFPRLNDLICVKDEHLKVIVEISRVDIDLVLLNAFKFFKKTNHLKVTINQDSFDLETITTKMNVKQGSIEFKTNEHRHFTVDTKYMIDALEAFVKFSNCESMKMYYQGVLRPIIFESDDMKMVVLPIRTE